MAEVPLSVVQGFIRDLGLNPGQVTELHITRESVRVTRLIPLGPVEVDVADVVDAVIACGHTRYGLDCALPDGHEGSHHGTQTILWTDEGSDR